MQVYVAGAPVTLDPADFVAAGGEGAVYARHDVAYKVFTDPARALGAAALAELARLTHPNIVRPDQLICDRAGQPLGFTMPYLARHHALCRLFTRSFRDRHGLGPDRILSLVRQLRDVVASAHRVGFVIVDLSEVNVLVSPDLASVHLIDVTSWQTPTRPATACTESIRDRHATAPSTATDWFAFAILTFQLFVGIHPYRGTHPTLKGLDARMQHHASAFSPDVKLPPVCYPLDSIPAAWRAWLEDTLQRGHRTPPPTHDHGAVAWVPRAIAATGTVTVTPLHQFDGPVRLFAERAGCQVAVTSQAVFVDGRRTLTQPGVEAIAFSPRANQPVIAWRVGDQLKLANAVTGRPIAVALQADALATAGDRLVVQRLDNLVEIGLHDLTVRPGQTGRVLATPRILTQVPRHATQLFDGVAFFRPLGATWLALLPRSGACVQVRVPELDGVKVVEAHFERGVLVLRDANWTSWVLRFDGARYDLRMLDEDVDANLAVTDAGVAVRLANAGLELFRPILADPGLRTVADVDVHGRLVRLDGGLGVVQGSRVYRLSLGPN